MDLNNRCTISSVADIWRENAFPILSLVLQTHARLVIYFGMPKILLFRERGKERKRDFHSADESIANDEFERKMIELSKKKI